MADTVTIDTKVKLKESGSVEVQLYATGSSTAKMTGPLDTDACKLENTLIQGTDRVISSATATIAATDERILVDYTATGTVTLTLPSAATALSHHYFIKDSGHNAGLNAITVTTPDSAEIDGLASFPMNISKMSMQLTCDGTNWHIW